MIPFYLVRKPVFKLFDYFNLNGIGHDFVKEMGKKAKREGRNLLEVSLEDSEFRNLYDGLPDNKREILEGKLENYMGSSKERAEQKNIAYVKGVIRG